jgi:hypothetical protein
MTHGLQTEEYGAEGRLSEGRPYNGVRTGKMCLTKTLKEMVHSAVSLYAWSCVQYSNRMNNLSS